MDIDPGACQTFKANRPETNVLHISTDGILFLMKGWNALCLEYLQQVRTMLLLLLLLLPLLLPPLAPAPAVAGVLLLLLLLRRLLLLLALTNNPIFLSRRSGIRRPITTTTTATATATVTGGAGRGSM